MSVRLSTIEVDGSERLEEMLRTLEDKDLRVEADECGHGFLKWVCVTAIGFEAYNVALTEECIECAREAALDARAERDVA